MSVCNHVRTVGYTRSFPPYGSVSNRAIPILFVLAHFHARKDENPRDFDLLRDAKVPISLLLIALGSAASAVGGRPGRRS